MGAPQSGATLPGVDHLDLEEYRRGQPLRRFQVGTRPPDFPCLPQEVNQGMSWDTW